MKCKSFLRELFKKVGWSWEYNISLLNFFLALQILWALRKSSWTLQALRLNFLGITDTPEKLLGTPGTPAGTPEKFPGTPGTSGTQDTPEKFPGTPEKFMGTPGTTVKFLGTPGSAEKL